MTSIGTSKKAKAVEVPPGKNNEKNRIPYFWKLIILIPIKLEILNVKVIIKWLVSVKLKGIKPIKFNIKTNTKRVNTRGKNLLELGPLIFSEINDKINL